MRYRRIIGVLLCWQFNFIACFTQYDSAVFKLVNNPVLKEYNLRKMCIDKTGKFWFATDKGIVRYDGNDILLFDHQDDDNSSIPVSSTGRLYLDDSNNLYVYEIPGVAYMNTRSGKFMPLNIEVKNEYKSKLAFPYPYSKPFIDDDGSIWVGMYNVGLIHYSRKTNETEYYPLQDKLPFQNNNVSVVKRDMLNKNLLWLATDDGIYSFDKTIKQFKRNYRAAYPKDSSTLNLEVNNIEVLNDTIWFTASGTGMGCYVIKTGFYTMFPFKEKETNKIVSLNIDFLQRGNHDEYYISEDDKLPGVFNKKTHTYRFVSNTSENLPAIQLRHFVADSTDNVWALIFYQLYFAKNPVNKVKTFKLPADDPVNKLENAFKLALWNKQDKHYYVAFDTRNKIFVLDSNMKLSGTIPIESYNKKNYALSVTPQIGTRTMQLVNKASDEPNIFDMGFDDSGRLWLCGTLLWMYEKAIKKIVPVILKPAINVNELRFQNLVFRGNYLYLQPSALSSHAVYKINTKDLTCDSIMLPDKVLKDTSGNNQSEKNIDVLQIDSKQKFAYFCYNRTVFQLELATNKTRSVVTFTKEEKPFQHFFNMLWYVTDNMDNLWIASLSGIKVYEPEHLSIIKTIPFEKDVYPIQLCTVNEKNIICVLNSNGLLLIDYKNNNQFKLGLNDGLITVFNSGVSCVNNMLFAGAVDYLQYIPLAAVIKQDVRRSCYLSSVRVFNKIITTGILPELIDTLRLKYDQNFITLSFSSTEFDQPERLEYRYKMQGINKNWVNANYLNRTISYNNVKPGDYVFYAEVKNPDGTWSNNNVHLAISVIPPWWRTNIFRVLFVVAIISGIYFFMRWRIAFVRRQEQLKNKHEKELLELEAKALRAQMNPHFVFNCMNSIKSLIQKNEQEQAINYLVTFSKLIRTVFKNSNKRNISLHDEIETCRLYMQLESMRFNNRMRYAFEINTMLDLKSVMVPALIIQPFIENAIWHGIMPKEEGGCVVISVDKQDNQIRCMIEDDGIGRETSKQNKFTQEDLNHESKGEHLTQARLDLDNLLNERKARIEIVDKMNNNNKPAGTLVIIYFEEYY